MAPSRRLGPLLAVAAALLTACAGDPGAVDPSGIDGLDIPTASPDPEDFVESIDNPYLPLQPGNEWVYDVTGEESVTLTVTVTDETREVDGVTTTVVSEVVTDADGEVTRETSDWFAQDAEGNVWGFGTDGAWEAGVDGAQAGLAMPATPRLGDGWQREYDPGEAEDRAEVVSVSEERQLATGLYVDLLTIEETTPLEPDLVERDHYARGTGLVQRETVSGGTEQVALVSFTEG